LFKVPEDYTEENILEKLRSENLNSSVSLEKNANNSNDSNSPTKL